MPGHFYEGDTALSQYLLLHYGTREQVLPYELGPADALDFPVRCVHECLDTRRLPGFARALDLGCAVGRSSFELATRCHEVVGIDASSRFIATARRLAERGEIDALVLDEGRLWRPARFRVPEELPRHRVRFLVGDADDLPSSLGTFDVVLMANLIDRLPAPGRCLRSLPALVNAGGQVIITSPYTWSEQYTPPDRWLGGFERDGGATTTFEGLRRALRGSFELLERKDLPLLIREHARKYQWTVAEASIWIRS